MQYQRLCRLMRTIEDRRNEALAQLRADCKHLRIVELDGEVPVRICALCGAEERGLWNYSFTALCVAGETGPCPDKHERRLVLGTTDPLEFYSYRKEGPLYPVGRSHPAFGLR